MIGTDSRSTASRRKLLHSSRMSRSALDMQLAQKLIVSEEIPDPCRFSCSLPRRLSGTAMESKSIAQAFPKPVQSRQRRRTSASFAL